VSKGYLGYLSSGSAGLAFLNSAGSATPNMLITDTGGVGIGTASPAAMLHITGASAGTNMVLDNGAPGDNWFQIRSNGVSKGYLGYLSSGSAGLAFLNSAGSAAANMLITDTGRVGIGTTSPQHLLHVAGTIGAQEVIVSSTGADYVFEPGYRLAPLGEVADYIKANHHLPEIPSAKDVEEKGVGLGEMQSKLLAKIEELTLHMIAAEKENGELRERIARLERGGDNK
jgi:hypothetical protein